MMNNNNKYLRLLKILWRFLAIARNLKMEKLKTLLFHKNGWKNNKKSLILLSINKLDKKFESYKRFN